MRSYHRQTRQAARRWLRWLSAGRVQADDLRVTWALWAIAAAIVLSTVATPAQAQTTVATPAQAQTTVRCSSRGTQPGFYRVQGRTVGVCYVYRPRGVVP